MKSRLLSHLDAAIEASGSQAIKADCLRAERAGLLARQGQLDEARAVIAALHAQYAERPNASVSAWLSLAEGLVSYFNDMSRHARDKVQRAYALSAVARERRLQGLAAAWLAHMAYVEFDLEPMARSLSEAFMLAEPERHGTRARACLVVAQSYHYGGRFDLANPWYAQSRQHASADGDEAMVSAIMHNMAGLMANEARQLELYGNDDAEMARRAMLSAECTSNFDALIGTGSLDALVPLLRAQVCTVQGRWSDAVDLYEAHFSDGLVQGLDRMRACLGADLAWCRLQLGQTAQALRDANAAEVAVAYDRDVDDRAAAHSRLAQVYDKLGHEQSAHTHRTQAALDWAAHQRDQAQCVALVTKVVESVRL